jgi:hypothetical protein
MAECRFLADVLRGTRGPPGPPGPGGTGGASSAYWDPFRNRLTMSCGVPGPRGNTGRPGPTSEARSSAPLASPFGGRAELIAIPTYKPNPQLWYLWAANAAAVNNAVGYFAKHVTTTANPPPLPLMSGTSGFGSAALDPWLIMDRWRLIDIKAVCAGAAVSQATVGASPLLRLTFYQIDEAGTTLIMNQDLPCISGSANIGVSNNATGRTALIYFAKHQFNPRLEPAPFTFLGWRFQNLNANNNQINCCEVTSTALVFERMGT